MNRPIILIAADDPIVLETLRSAFEALECNVVAAQNGQQALEMCINKRPFIFEQNS